MKKLLTSFVLILTAIALTGCGSASKTMARNLDNTITNLVYSVSNLDVLDKATINQVKSLNSNQKAAQSALCFLTNDNANNSIFANTTCPECCQSGECNEDNCDNIDVTDSPNKTTDNKNKIVKNAISGLNVKNIDKFSQKDDEIAKLTGEHPYVTTHPDVRKIDTNNAYESNENFCKNNQTNCDNCNPIRNEPINIDHGLSVGDPNSTTNNANSSANNNDNNTVTSNIKDDISTNNNNNSTGNSANYNTSTGNYTNSNTNTDNNDDVDTADNRNNGTTKNNSIGINSENITDGDANKILNHTGITTGGTDIDTSTSTNSIYSDLATSSVRISELIADLVKVRTVIMLYISDLYNGSITLSQDEINAINSYANIIKESTAYLKSNQGTVKNHLNEATSFGETDAYASLANSHIIRATEVLNTRGAKIESAVVATMNIIDILKTNVENAKSQSTTGNSSGTNPASNTAVDTKGQNANTSQILEGNVANASFEGSGLFGGGSPNYAMNNPYNMGVNGQNYGGGAYTFGAAYPMGGINYGMGGVGTIGAYPYGANVGAGMINGMAYPYGMGGNGVGISGAAIYPYGMGVGTGIGTYPYGMGVGTGIGTYPYGAGVGIGTGIANGMSGFGYPNGGAIIDGNGAIGEVGMGGAGIAGNGIIGNGAGVAGGVGVGTGVVNSGVGNTNINGGAMPNVLTGLVSSDDQQPLTDAKTNIDDNITLSNNNNTDNNNSNTKTQADAQPLTNTQQCDSDQVNLANENIACASQPYTICVNKKNIRTYTPNPLFDANVNKKSFYDLATQDYINTSSAADEALPATKPNIIIPADDNQYPAAQLPNADNQYPAAQLPNGDERYPIITLPDTSQRRPVTTI